MLLIARRLTVKGAVITSAIDSAQVRLYSRRSRTANCWGDAIPKKAVSPKVRAIRTLSVLAT